MKSLTLALVAILALAGCASSTEGSASKTEDPHSAPESSSPVPDSQLESDEDSPTITKEIGRAVLRQRYPDLTAGASDEDIDDLAETTCDAWDAGATPEDMVIASMDEGLEGETGALMALAATVYCPEHKHLVDAFADAAY